jgi:uncharacterized protein with HEPN domain
MSRPIVPELLSEVVRNADRIMTLIDRHEQASEDDARTIRSAILWHFIVIGEASNRLGAPFHEEHAAIPWRDIIDQRNVIAHGYDAIDWNLLFALRKDALPKLIAEANKVLNLYSPPSEP